MTKFGVAIWMRSKSKEKTGGHEDGKHTRSGNKSTHTKKKFQNKRGNNSERNSLKGRPDPWPLMFVWSGGRTEGGDTEMKP